MKLNGRNILASSVVVILLLVIQFAKPSSGGLWLRTLYDSLHAPVFGIIAVCVLFITPAHWETRKRLVVVIVTVIGLSVLSEVAQIPTGRDASFEDLIADWLGAAGFVSIAIGLTPGFSVKKDRGRYLVLLGVVLMAWPLAPLARTSAAYMERNLMVPSLVQFDSRFAATFFRMQNADLTKLKGDNRDSVSADIRLQDGPWPGIIFHDPWPNWEPYTTLIIEIENPESADLRLSVRVHDRDHNVDQRYSDRFNRTIELAPGLQTIRITLEDIKGAPAERQMSMAEIDGLVVFATQQESGRHFILHEIRLE